MMKQSYTSFLNNVHQKANFHIFVIKVNKSTGHTIAGRQNSVMYAQR